MALLLALVAIEICGPRAEAVAPERDVGQYNAILERNVFGLRPPVAEALPTNPPIQLPKITLTGITTILGNKRALMMLAPLNLKPGDTNRQVSLILTEGQREAEVEVLLIDENKGCVRVNNSGTIMTLTFEKDGAKLPSTPPPRTNTPPPPLPTALPATAGMSTSPYAPRTRSGIARNVPGRNPRAGSAQVPATASVANPSAPVGGIPNPTGLVASPSPTSSNPETDLTPEEQAIVNAIQREANSTIPTFGGPGASNQPAPDSTASSPANTTVPNPAPVLPQ